MGIVFISQTLGKLGMMAHIGYTLMHPFFRVGSDVSNMLPLYRFGTIRGDYYSSAVANQASPL